MRRDSNLDVDVVLDVVVDVVVVSDDAESRPSSRSRLLTGGEATWGLLASRVVGNRKEPS